MVDYNLKNNPTVKFLCSYSGKIHPRYPDGKLRYVGGETRVLSVDRSVTFQKLKLKLGELCGSSDVSLRCILPTEDLNDALVSVTSDEDLTNLIQQYDRASPSLKIRAFLFFPKPHKIPPPSTVGSPSITAPIGRSGQLPVGFPVPHEKSKSNRCYGCCGNYSDNIKYLVHNGNGNHWQ